MHRIADASAAQLGRQPKFGFVVLPANMSTYKGMFDDFMHEVFSFEHPQAQRGDYIEYDIVDHRTAAKRAFNLTNPDTLGAPWAKHGREVWDHWHDMDPDLIFADEDNYILLVNFEPDFLELTYMYIRPCCLYGDVPPSGSVSGAR